MKKHLSFFILTGLLISAYGYAGKEKKIVWKRSTQQWVPYNQRGPSYYERLFGCLKTCRTWLGTMQGGPFSIPVDLQVKKPKSE